MTVEFKHSPLPCDLVKGNEHHGPYLVNAYGGDICDFYTMSNPNAISVRNGGTSYPVHFADAAENAEFAWRAINSFQALLDTIMEIDKSWSECFPEGPDVEYWCNLGDEHRTFWRNARAAIALATKPVEDYRPAQRDGGFRSIPVASVTEGDEVLVRAVVKEVIAVKTNWPVRVVLDTGASETIDKGGCVHYSAIIAAYKKGGSHG